MKKIINQLRSCYLLMFSGLLLLTACNKALEEFPPIPTPTYPPGKGIAATIAGTPNDSLYSRLIIRSGMASILNDSTKTFTIFATDNAGMRIFVNAASGGAIPINAPDAVHSNFIANTLPVASAVGIISYNTVGQKFPSGSIPATLPNYPLPTQIILDPTQQFVRMPIFPAKGTPYSYVNNLPLTAVDQAASDGIIHHTFTIVAPLPASPVVVTLSSLISGDANLTYFKAAIARGDSGQVGISGVGPYGLQFDSLMRYPVTNMTVLAPNNAACQTLIFGSVYGALIAQGVPPATAAATATAIASSPAGFDALPVATVRGVVAYHILASKNTGSFKPDIRAFSVNFSSAANSYVTTLVNGTFPTHPGILAQATFTGPSVTALKFAGAGTFPPGGAPFSMVANATSWDKMALNGVLHTIDKVLLPQ